MLSREVHLKDQNPDSGGLVVRLLGRPQIFAGDGAVIAIPGRKIMALLAYLLQCSGMRASRGKISDVLWGNRDDEHARNNLRHTLSVLRKDLSPYDPDLLVSAGDTLLIRPGSVHCDTHQLEALSHEGSAQLQECARLYGGPFLDGFSSGSATFDEWIGRERDRLAQVMSAVFEQLAMTSAGASAVDYARRLLATDPFREASHRILMEKLAAAGDHDLALREYDNCKSLLQKELGVPPDRETQQLREKILHARTSRVSTAGRTANISDRAKEAAEARVFLGIRRFTNLGGSGPADLFAVGLEHDLISELATDREITVRAERGSGEPNAGGADSPERSNRYGVRFLLNGSIQSVKSGLRVNATLVDTGTNVHVWAEHYEGESTSDFQTELCGLIISAVRLELLLGKFNLRDKAPPDSPAIRQIVNRAIVCFFQQTHESVTKAISLAEQALAIDPASVRGRRTYSAAISASVTLGALPRSRENLDRALALAQEVVLVAPYDEIARCELAWALSNAGHHAESADQLRHAISLNPSSPNARADLAEQLAIMGEADEALKEVQQAFALSGYDPLEIWRHSTTAMAQFIMGNYPEALEISRQLARAEPAFTRGVVYWAASAAALGLEEEAHRALTHLMRVSPDVRIETLAPTCVPRFTRRDHHERLLSMMRKAGLPD